MFLLLFVGVDVVQRVISLVFLVETSFIFLLSYLLAFCCSFLAGDLGLCLLTPNENGTKNNRLWCDASFVRIFIFGRLERQKNGRWIGVWCADARVLEISRKRPFQPFPRRGFASVFFLPLFCFVLRLCRGRHLQIPRLRHHCGLGHPQSSPNHQCRRIRIRRRPRAARLLA